jgi:hypothetical protein
VVWVRGSVPGHGSCGDRRSGLQASYRRAAAGIELMFLAGPPI